MDEEQSNLLESIVGIIACIVVMALSLLMSILPLALAIALALWIIK